MNERLIVSGGYRARTGVKSGSAADECKAAHQDDICGYVSCAIEKGIPEWAFPWDQRVSCLGKRGPS
ncbi:MAG: hypothetical protein HY675_27395 [Chloroflexi bacterium]|nr:hypothetical protein [Chloroflexota bacterium]